MILIVAESGTEAAGEAIAAALTSEFSLPVAPELVSAIAVWDRQPEWDDLLIVIFRSDTLPARTVSYINAYRDAHGSAGPIIPVSADAALKKPPDPISGIRAAHYDNTAEATARIVRAAGVFLGIALRPGTQRIFIAYRATDGAELAEAIHARLKSEGFEPWLDVAKDAIDIGDDVQEHIRRTVDGAAMVLVIDTPDAPESKWIKVEIDMAVAQLVPVLPVIVSGERTSRFIQLQSLRRQALLDRDSDDPAPLIDFEWNSIRSEIEQVLLASYRRRMRILTRVQRTFEANGYRWRVIDDRLRMYRADKKRVPPMVVLSHCSVHDITYVPALRAWWDYVKSYKDIAAVNQKLCVYDRDRVLSEPEMETLASTMPDMNAILAHYNEVELLVSTNFGVLRL
jgi:hypothetical protein